MSQDYKELFEKNQKDFKNILEYINKQNLIQQNKFKELDEKL